MSGPMDRLSAALAGRYRIERELGAGGMATVYLAEDLKHHRQVAIKVLKPELAAVLGAERFVQEIQTTASLQHPNILPLHDSGDAGGLLFYVMPYVEGESLRDKLNRESQLSIDEAVKITTEVGDALDYAHAHGVVHRDIKPENILLHAGRPMVADFGIALAVSAAAGGRMTETGMSLGTPHYMSPEQATAEKQITGRSDIYSLGAVLYEMLTGDPPHTGKTAQQIIMKIVTEKAAPVTKLRRSVPPNVAAAISKALEKLPADRFDSAKAFAEALGNPGFRHGTLAVPGAAAGRGGRPVAAGWLGWAVVGAAALLLGLALGRSFTGGKKTFDIGLPIKAPMVLGASPVPSFAVSADGSFMVYLSEKEDGTSQLWYRSLVDSSARPVPGTEGAWFAPLISPDGRRVAFLSVPGGGMEVMPIDGGPVSKVSDDVDAWGGSWLSDGMLFYARSDNHGLRWVDPQTGPVRDLAMGYCPMPELLSKSEVICGGGEQKFAQVGDMDVTPFTLRPVMQTTVGGDRIPLRGSDFHLLDGKYLVYTSVDASIMATKFVNRDSLLLGRSVALVQDVARPFYTGAGYYHLDRDGTLVYAPGANMEMAVLVRRTLGGKEDTLPGGPARHLRFDISPDGRHLASAVEGLRDQELRLYDLRTGSFEVLDHAPYLSTPFWGSGGTELIYQRERGDSSEVVARRLNSSERPRVLLDLPHATLIQYVDSSLMLFTIGTGQGILAVDASVHPARLDTVITRTAYFARVSPDRRWLVWGEEGEQTTYLARWPALNPRWTLSTGHPFEPSWLPDGTILLHEPPNPDVARTYTIAIHPGADPPHGPLTLRFGDPRMGETPGWSNAIASDGAIVYPLLPDQRHVHYVRVVPHWVGHMERAVDEANR